MARVSKKVSAAQREAENAPHRIWKTAIYARLSDFDDVLRDTESLEVQISYIKEYINHRDDLMQLDVFADKRCTGTNFDRPEFERLLKALQERKVNCYRKGLFPVCSRLYRSRRLYGAHFSIAGRSIHLCQRWV